VYFEVQATQSASTSTGSVTTQPTVTVTSETKTVPIGIIMSIMPSIDLANNEVTLSVHPTLSTTTGPGVEDPAVKYLAAQVSDPTITSVIPEIQVRDLDSTVRMKSGQTMVIGGLMQQTGDNSDSGVPFANDIPVLGNLFKGVVRSSTNKELVILIRASIVDTRGSMNKTDKEIFDTFSKDPRPVTF
jgi:general secretion pathway protein D